MAKTSVTSTESFTIRAQRSEATRVLLWFVVLAGLSLITLARRRAGGVVMSDNKLFYPYQGLLLFAMICQIGLLAALRRANRGGYLLPSWLSHAAAIFDLCTAAGLLALAAYLSPRGAVPALTAPPLLLLPLVVLMSVLRLRPAFTLGAGLAAALVHLLLALRAIAVTESPPEAHPVYLAYSGLLALTAVSGMFVARQMRAHVHEATDEAVAHERAEHEVFRMQQDLAIARQIQRGLLPARPPELDGFDICGMNRPADLTGGDYYDWQQLPDGRLAVVLADVAGHGIGPAIVMAVCRAYARSTAPTAPDAAALVARLNELLHDDLPSDRFITLVVGILHRDGTAHLSSAGHGPTFLYRASTGTVTQYNADGLPLGVNPTESYDPFNALTLGDGDVIMMLTDGFFEATHPGTSEGFGIQRLSEVLRSAAASDAQTILRTVDEAVSKYAQGAPQADDMTAIVIKRRSARER
jgi:serine phosphatase RsbU (regulator of sigma subunit)